MDFWVSRNFLGWSIVYWLNLNPVVQWLLPRLSVQRNANQGFLNVPFWLYLCWLRLTPCANLWASVNCFPLQFFSRLRLVNIASNLSLLGNLFKCQLFHQKIILFALWRKIQISPSFTCVGTCKKHLELITNELNILNPCEINAKLVVKLFQRLNWIPWMLEWLPNTNSSIIIFWQNA